MAAIHETTERWVRNLPILDADTWLLVHRVRVNCPDCGPRIEQLDWLDRWARFTRRFADSVVRLAAILPLKQAAEFYDLHWETVKRLHKEHLQRTLEPADLTGIEVIAMDELAIQRGQRYATVVVEPYRKQVLWVGRGRGREDVRPSYERLAILAGMVQPGDPQPHRAAEDVRPSAEGEDRRRPSPLSPAASHKLAGRDQ